jgi:hypothetical protein
VDNARRILAEISQLLGRYGYQERASFVGGLTDTSASEKDFWQTLAGLEFWGGSGAVWEVAPFHLTHPAINGSAEDYRRFQILMIDLAMLLESGGQSELASRRARLFRQQLQERP